MREGGSERDRSVFYPAFPETDSTKRQMTEGTTQGLVAWGVLPKICYAL